MIFTLAFYLLEGTIYTTVWTAKSLYRLVYPLPSDPLISDIQKKIDLTREEFAELKKLILEREKK